MPVLTDCGLKKKSLAVKRLDSIEKDLDVARHLMNMNNGIFCSTEQ